MVFVSLDSTGKHKRGHMKLQRDIWFEKKKKKRTFSAESQYRERQTISFGEKGERDKGKKV